MTLYLLSLVLPVGQELLGCEVAQGLVGTEGVVHSFPGQELLVEGGHLQREAVDFIELLRMRPLGALYTSVELGGARWEDKEADTPLLAGLLKGCLELASPIDLNGLHGKGHPALDGI